MKLKNIFVIVLSIVVLFSIGFSIIAHADYEKDDSEDAVVSSVIQSTAQPQSQSTVTITKPKTVTKTVVDPPKTVVVNETKSVVLPDSDHDGLVDAEDPHPKTPEIYFVKDDNQNGIVDSFENYVAQ